MVLNQKIILAILDGWGIDRAWGGNAITLAKTPGFDYLIKNYPNTSLKASGTFVGLPDSARGNSEAGHLNIGAGKIVHQDISIINQQIEDKSFYKNANLNKAIEFANTHNSNLHLMGLMSEGGNHSHINHLFALLKLCADQKFKRVYLDLFTDGRDSSPESGVEFIRQVESKIKELGVGHISSVSGRFYAMDRDNRWGRISRAYNALVNSQGEIFKTAEAGLLTSYANRITDEFVVPFLVADKDQLLTPIKDNDSVIFFNFRSDRAKQISQAFITNDFKGFLDRRLISNIFFVSFFPYEENINVHSAFGPEKVSLPLAAVLSQKNIKQFHIAETEKYAHVTFFFNGDTRQPFPGESRQLIPSPQVKTYDLAPKMSANGVKDNLIKKLDSDCGFYLVNFANADMVGHTGNLQATVQAVEEVDKCLGDLIAKAKTLGCLLVVCADHGNAEKMVDIYTGDPNMEHTSNPVPFILVDFSLEKALVELNEGKLSDIVPTILDYLKIDKPAEMTGVSLIRHNTK